MKRDGKSEARKRLARPAAGLQRQWDLRLYVAGQTPRSLVALTNLQRICEQHLQGRYHIQVIDLLVNPQLCHDDQIVAIPTLVRKLPKPIRKIFGDLSDTARTLLGLQLESGPTVTPEKHRAQDKERV